MEPDLLSVHSSALTLEVEDEHIVKAENDGLHVLTSGEINTMENLDTSRSINGLTTFPPSELLASDMERDGEITLHSSLIPENAILMETPRGLMLTVPDGISYEDISPNDSTNRTMLSCVPVSFFKTCDVNEDGEANVCGDVSVINQTDENLESHLDSKPSDITSLAKNICEDEELQSHHQIQMVDCMQTSKVDNVDGMPAKRKGGWPKGKKRKIRPEVTAPRAPVTGYVLYAIDRRKEIKLLHPELSFSEVTKVLGQEWSSMASSRKDKFLEAAEKDKKRYREELKAFRSSETYQETVNKKMMLQEEEMGSSNTMGALVIDDEDNTTELHCKVCNVYFSSSHNKKEHMYGKTHLQNVTDAVDKQHKKQRQQEQQNLFTSLGGSSEECLAAVDDSASWPAAADSNTSGHASGTKQSGPVDIHHFMLEFIQKNYEREQEISSLRKHLNKSLQDNLIMCKDIQELQEYHCKLQEEVKALSSTTSSLLVQSDALKMVPTLFGIINL